MSWWHRALSVGPKVSEMAGCGVGEVLDCGCPGLRCSYRYSDLDGRLPDEPESPVNRFNMDCDAGCQEARIQWMKDKAKEEIKVLKNALRSNTRRSRQLLQGLRNNLSGTLFSIVDVDFVIVPGYEGSFGQMLNLDNLGDSGFYVSFSDAFGFNRGVGVGGGYVRGRLDGDSQSIDINIGELSPTIIFDGENKYQGFAISVGPGVGASVSRGKTYVLTVNMLLRSLGLKSAQQNNP